MEISFDFLSSWYKKNLGRIVLLLIFVVVFTLSLSYIPYLNIFVSPALGFGLSVIVWYILFYPDTRILVSLSFGVLLVAMLLSLLKIPFLAESIADVLYLFLIFILINYIREFAAKKTSTE